MAAPKSCDFFKSKIVMPKSPKFTKSHEIQDGCVWVEHIGGATENILCCPWLVCHSALRCCYPHFGNLWYILTSSSSPEFQMVLSMPYLEASGVDGQPTAGIRRSASLPHIKHGVGASCSAIQSKGNEFPLPRVMLQQS